MTAGKMMPPSIEGLESLLRSSFCASSYRPGLQSWVREQHLHVQSSGLSTVAREGWSLPSLHKLLLKLLAGRGGSRL